MPWNMPDDIGECFCGRPIRAGAAFCDDCGAEVMVTVATRDGAERGRCTRGELWAAIEDFESASYEELPEKRARVRDLLGMETTR